MIELTAEDWIEIRKDELDLQWKEWAEILEDEMSKTKSEWKETKSGTHYELVTDGLLARREESNGGWEFNLVKTIHEGFDNTGRARMLEDTRLGDLRRKRTFKRRAADSEIGEEESIRRESKEIQEKACLLYTSPSPRDRQKSRMPSSA